MKLGNFTPPLERCQQGDLRLTVKVICVDRLGRILICSSGSRKKYGSKIANFPGGGINLHRGEDVVSGLGRELAEELNGLVIAKRVLKACKVLHEAEVPTGKTGWAGKYLVLVFLKVKSVKQLRTDGRELGAMVVAKKKKEALAKLSRFDRTRRPTMAAYIAALKKL